MANRIVREDLESGVVAWYNKDTEMLEAVWKDEGVTAIPMKSVGMYEHIIRFEDMCKAIKHLDDKELYICTRCAQIFNKPPALRHFAGIYCSDCADEHKQIHSGTCMSCRQPHWRCTC